ncbi:hypothetical protein Zmor_008249 [Zophobas morio]|uniref:Uncharacterized protein n=1 Tax=Zophobas morio TaxID=2755281 RepID=A0AA38MQH0_9CUCU|nr:hypothetical protein Zmor_008249 [Zophobas morio]
MYVQCMYRVDCGGRAEPTVCCFCSKLGAGQPPAARVARVLIHLVSHTAILAEPLSRGGGSRGMAAGLRRGPCAAPAVTVSTKCLITFIYYLENVFRKSELVRMGVAIKKGLFVLPCGARCG